MRLTTSYRSRVYILNHCGCPVLRTYFDARVRMACINNRARCLQFMEYIARHHVINDAPEVFNAYLDVLTALATGTKGAQASHPGPYVPKHRTLDPTTGKCSNVTKILTD